MASPVSIDYTSKDYAAFRESMLEHASRRFPAWSQASEGDLGMALIETMAYAADILSYYGDRIAAEAYITTATQRRSILNLAAMYGYKPADPIPAMGEVTFKTELDNPETLVPAGTQIATAFQIDLDAPIVFETDIDVYVPATGGTINVTVTQGRTVTDESLGVSTGAIEQSFRLYNTPVIHTSVYVTIGDDQAGWDEFTYIEHILDAGPEDPVFATYTDESGVMWLLFGDGVNGRIPSAGATIRATYRIGGGSAGNVASGAVDTLLSAIDGVYLATDDLGVSLSSEMAGGANAESIEEIRINAPRSFRAQDRCVTIKDYEDVALSVSGINKAVAVGNTYASITIFAAGPRGVPPSQALLDRAQAGFVSKAQVGTTVTVLAAQTVKINVTLELHVTERFSQRAVKAEVIRALQNYLGFDSQNFGQRIPLAAIYRTVVHVAGIDYATVVVLAREDGSQEIADDIIVREWELPTFGSITIASVVGGIA